MPLRKHSPHRETTKGSLSPSRLGGIGLLLVIIGQLLLWFWSASSPMEGDPSPLYVETFGLAILMTLVGLVLLAVWFFAALGRLYEAVLSMMK